MLNFNGYNIPNKVQVALTAFVEHGVPVDDFLYAVLSNNLYSAVSCANVEEQKALKDIVSWINDYAPSPCWGAEAKVLRWVEIYSKELA
jgi:hypothetical protein